MGLLLHICGTIALLGLGAEGVAPRPPGPEARETVGPARAGDALVFVLYQGAGRARGCYGVAVGDGSLVASCYPMALDSPSSAGWRGLAGRVIVVSPYLGDVADAQILATEPPALIVLKVPWRGHPSAPLADEQSIPAADRMMLLGRPEAAQVLAGERRDSVDVSGSVQEIDAEVDYVAMQQGRPWFVELVPREPVSIQWAGAPIVLPPTRHLVALAMPMLGEGRSVEGPLLHRVKSLAPYLRASETAPAAGVLRPPPDAAEAFALYVRSMALLRGKQYGEAATTCRRFIELRPHCFFGYMGAADAAEGLGQTAEAERWHREGLAAAADSLTGKVSYASFLDRQGRLEEALQILESLWQQAALRPYLAGGIYSVLDRKGEHAHCLQFLEEALVVDPNYAPVWICVGNSRNALRQYEAAAAAFGKAADLWPEHDTVRTHFARNLELGGRLDEADTQYRKAVAAHPKSEYAHHLFASFLARHRPERRAEALQEARTASGLQAGDASDRESLERLIRDLEAVIE